MRLVDHAGGESRTGARVFARTTAEIRRKWMKSARLERGNGKLPGNGEGWWPTLMVRILLERWQHTWQPRRLARA